MYESKHFLLYHKNAKYGDQPAFQPLSANEMFLDIIPNTPNLNEKFDLITMYDSAEHFDTYFCVKNNKKYYARFDDYNSLFIEELVQEPKTFFRKICNLIRSTFFPVFVPED